MKKVKSLLTLILSLFLKKSFLEINAEPSSERDNPLFCNINSEPKISPPSSKRISGLLPSNVVFVPSASFI